MTRFPFAGLLTACFFATSAHAATVHVTQGDISGQTQGPVTAYLGLPYAAPPVGANRWQPPQAPAKWTGVHDATQFAANCQQNLTGGLGPWTLEYEPHGAVSEDCLYLNVWAPTQADKPLPVMVWIHGGAFTGGSGSVAIYNGAGLATQGVIVVTLNYRVGIYGFLAHPDLGEGSGTYGLLDQIAALQWVHDNIAAFGGDPTRVTVAGQSAGAASVHDLMASPRAKGLFQQAIAESGSGLNPPPGDLATAQQLGVAVLTAAGARSLDDLRKLTPAELDAAAAKVKANGQRVSFAPSIDGVVLPDADAVSREDASDVPILTGMTGNEDSFASYFFPDTLTPETYITAVEKAYGDQAGVILKLYPAGDTTHASRDALARDSELASMTAWAAKRLSWSRKPIFAYLWTHPEPGPTAAKYGAFHSSEVPYVFRTLNAANRPFTAEDHALSQTISDYWLNFIKTGNPNSDGLPQWPVFDPGQSQINVIDVTTQARPVLPAETLEIFKRHLANGGKTGRP